MRRVVITGLGIVAPTGNNVKDAWQAAMRARSGIALIRQFDASHLKVRIAAEVKEFVPEGLAHAKDERRLTRFMLFAAAAAKQAMDDSGLSTVLNPARYGCILGVGIGGLPDIEANAYLLQEHGEKRISPFAIPYIIPNMAAGYVSIIHQLKGPILTHSSACASGTHAIGEAFQAIRFGVADAFLCGGAESSISPLSIASFGAMRTLSTRNDDPARASRPFDATRDGFVMGEGAGMLVIEELEHALRRQARIYAEVIGYGLSADGFHITTPPDRHEGAARCMQMALNCAQISPESVDYINAHGTSTQLNDQYESEAIQDVFKDYAPELAVSSTKGVTGHCLGATGGMEAVFTTLAVHQGIVPPTAHLDHPDPKCPLDYVPHEARIKNIRVALSNSFGFGGMNATLAFARYNKPIA